MLDDRVRLAASEQASLHALGVLTQLSAVVQRLYLHQAPSMSETDREEMDRMLSQAFARLDNALDAFEKLVEVDAAR